jgi:uncharacterized protein DUF4375
MIEPYWLPLNESWDEGADAFLVGFRSVPAKVGHLYAAHWCQSEVCNGGFYQFFFNTTGLLAPEALNAFGVIGLDEWSSVLAEAISYFGQPYPRERFHRIDQLRESNVGKRENWDLFSALDDRFFEWLHAQSDRWDRAADNYARSA